MKLLIIEDDKLIAKSLSNFFKSNNYIFDLASDGETGFNLADNNSYDLIITDYLLPKMNGKEIIKQLRKNGNKTPILAISICNETNDKSTILNHGADDYLVKPFFFKELQARINVLLRRKIAKVKNFLSYADLKLDLVTQEAWRDNRNIYLTTKEFLLLKLLLENPHKIFSKSVINESAWFDSFNNKSSNIIEAYILKLRQKIDFKDPLLIKTVSGRGYKIDINN